MDTLDLQQIRELAEKRRHEDALIAQLPILERQAASELALEKAAFESDVLSSQFDIKATEYQAKLGEMQNRLLSLFAELDKAQADLESLGRDAKSLSNLAYQLADKKTRSGEFNHLARQMGLKQFDRFFVEGQSQELLKRKFGLSELFAYRLNGNESELTKFVLDAFSRLVHLAQVSPTKHTAVPTIETFQPGRTR